MKRPSAASPRTTGAPPVRFEWMVPSVEMTIPWSSGCETRSIQIAIPGGPCPKPRPQRRGPARPARKPAGRWRRCHGALRRQATAPEAFPPGSQSRGGRRHQRPIPWGLVMDRLSKPLEDLDPHYDVVVVGSGYGGSIAACRLSRAGPRSPSSNAAGELHPGEYPSTIDAARRYMQVSAGDNQIGDARDLFWVHTGGNINVLSGCGLGGTSLINANVVPRADPRVFEDACWPRGLHNDQAGIEAAYARAEQRSRLRPTPRPSCPWRKWRRSVRRPTARPGTRHRSMSPSGPGPMPQACTKRLAPDVATA